MIINTVNSLKSLLTTNIRNQGELKNDCDKYKKIKEYSILLTNLYEILGILLKNLLSSHVDNYRDSSIIDQTINLIILLANYLYENYSNFSSMKFSKENNLQINNNEINPLVNTFEENNSYNIIEYLQNLLQNTLNTFKEMCKFNTSIKLSFERILEKVAEKPSNKGPMIYVLNFILNVVTNEYTIETFIENFRKTQKRLSVDVYNDIEYNIKANPVRLSNLFEERNFIKYAIEIGTSCENEWIVENAAKFLLTLKRCYVSKAKENLYQEISEALISSLNSAFNKISKFECLSILNEKVNKILKKNYNLKFIKIIIFIFLFFSFFYFNTYIYLGN